MVESWKDLEKRITNTDAKELRHNLLNAVNFILDSYGAPGQYYGRTNNQTNEINKKLMEFRHVRVIALGQEDETLMKNLYKECSGKKNIDENYRVFYVGFCKGTMVPCYGDMIGEEPGHFGPYTVTLNSLWGLKQLLETGKDTDSNGNFDKYNRDVDASSNGPESNIHYS
ncbi:MAG: hypothetical protein AABW84_00600 [Nanoarchaeota archaeon]